MYKGLKDNLGINKKIGVSTNRVPLFGKKSDEYDKELKKLENKQKDMEKKEEYDKKSKFGKSISDFGSSANKTLKSIKFKTSKLGRFR